jgi:hypothetical protein
VAVAAMAVTAVTIVSAVPAPVPVGAVRAAA